MLADSPSNQITLRETDCVCDQISKQTTIAGKEKDLTEDSETAVFVLKLGDQAVQGTEVVCSSEIIVMRFYPILNHHRKIGFKYGLGFNDLLLL